MSTVKKLQPGEIKAVGFSVWNQWKGPAYFENLNVEYLLSSFENLVEMNLGVGYGLFQDNSPVGILLGLITPDLHTGKMLGVTYLWGVLPEHRKNGGGGKLLQVFEEDCKQAGCFQVVCGSMSGHLEEKVKNQMRAMYSRAGYALHTESFSKVLKSE